MMPTTVTFSTETPAVDAPSLEKSKLEGGKQYGIAQSLSAVYVLGQMIDTCRVGTG